jgi:dienelactone hydrolase
MKRAPIRKAGALALAALLLGAAAVEAQTSAQRRNPADPATWTTGRARDYRAPEDVAFRTVSILSEGVRLHGEMFAPKAQAGRKLPTIIMAHGWGGTASGFRRDAEQLTRAGFQVLTFDYRGWGESDSRVILTGAPPTPLPTGRKFTAQVEAVRGYVDPVEQAQDWFNVINWAAAEPTVDANRIGIRGSSFSGGLVVHVAANDPRVKALVSQVGSIPVRADVAKLPAAVRAGRQAAESNAARMARGEVGYPEPGAQVLGALIGAPMADELNRWAPGEDAKTLRTPALFIVAENEELFDNREHAILAHTNAKGPKRLVVIPGIKHYGVYTDKREEVVNLAADWFKQHLQ